MTTAREEILGRIRTALGDRPAQPAVARDYHRDLGAGDVDLFVERVADYHATVHRCDRRDVATTVDSILNERQIASVVVADGLPADWVPAIDVVSEPVDTATLDQVGAVLTACAVAIAETGTIVLDAGPGQGTRALTLVPDYHLVVVRAEQIVAGVPAALAALDATRPLTWISGPSATSDIELNRVEGVHGPRTLEVLVVEPAESDEEQKVGARAKAESPASAKTGGWRTAVDGQSPGAIMLFFFLGSMIAQSVAGHAAYNVDQLHQHEDPVSWFGYATSSDYWNRTFRNWQSEFLAVASMAAFAIYLRHRGSPESKLVGASHVATAQDS